MLARPAHLLYTVGDKALTRGATRIYRRASERAHAGGHLPDLTADALRGLLTGLSAHSTRVG